ncbi:aminoglycoside phosphotransferase family protein [Roseovarius sp. SCSIO 43702]|uniref:phosphotransferase n=1 Tax=Roseovarius sp. SCSIO 43702 TaxID=2823043 RepID=UPI001C72CB13|nr:phosphotransferase [Roseovarius sp. SCSIO 43702]QYX55393.1 aminoglycoside phosphotransferase family protein [Roseovarius sp. SCSIO 43702]
MGQGPTDLDTLIALTARIEAARADDPALAACEPGELLRHVPDKRALLRCRLGSRAAIMRLGLAPGGSANARTWAEMRRLWPHMSDGDARIAEPLHFNAPHDLLLVEDVAGEPLLPVIRRARAGPARTRHLAPAAHWLRKVTRTSEATAPARPAPWLERAAKAATEQPFPALAGLEQRILPHLQALAARLEGRDWRVAISHGDFHPNNLILSGTRLTGIDIGGSSSLPIYKDMARFLMHMGRRDIDVSGAWWMGVDRSIARAFGDAFDLSDFETDVVLPFFLGVEALIRVESDSLPSSRIKRAERMYRRLLADLETTRKA